jgi:regulator of replication initiation timing
MPSNLFHSLLCLIFVEGREAERAVKKMKKEIAEMFTQLEDMRAGLRPLILERNGVNVLLTEQREKLMKLLARKDELYKQRVPLMEDVWETDADVIYEAFNAGFTVDKSALIDVLANRARWQINLIAEVFEKKYNMPLIHQIVSQMQTLFGSIVTGSNTNLCKLLIYRILDQRERDAALLKDNISDTDVICEIFATRSNQELRLAVEVYDSENVKPFAEVIQTKGYANYRKFMTEVLKFDRDETLDSFSKPEAKALAEELYKAGAGRLMGVDPEPFIRIFSKINNYQFDSISDEYANLYKKKVLKDDIAKKFGGDLENVLLSRCYSKYAYLAIRLDKAFRGLSVDKETLSRILGCITRKEGILLREAYDKGQFGRTLETALVRSNFSILCIQNLNQCLYCMV